MASFFDVLFKKVPPKPLPPASSILTRPVQKLRGPAPRRPTPRGGAR